MPSSASQPDAKFIVPRNAHTISKTDISDNALKVLNRITSQGYSAYLVGGGVRDLLLRIKPKDFDVATNATPNQIRRFFRNCRLIGRRFRLAHILFGRDIIEVSTFRRGVEESHDDHHHNEQGMIVRDNVFGSLEQDAFRRDFTINALYYDHHRGVIVDYTNGFNDLKNKTLRIIGDAHKRYHEDPVRMLRAIRFAAKLDFTIDEQSQEVIKQYGENLAQVPAARLFEEFIKLFHHGYALKTFELLSQFKLFQYLFPQTHAVIEDTSNVSPSIDLIVHTLNNTDLRVQQGKPVTPAFLLASFLWHPLLTEAKALEDSGIPPLPALEKAMQTILRQQAKVMSIPKRFSLVIREMWLMQYRLPRRYGKRAFYLLSHPRFRAGYDFLCLRGHAGEVDKSLCDWWTEFQEVDEEAQNAMIESIKKPRKRRRKPTQKKDNNEQENS